MKREYLSFEKTSRKKIFSELFAPFLVLITLDLAMTYYGVCIQGQIELNPKALVIGKFGYLFVCMFQYGEFIFMCGLIAIGLKHYNKNTVKKFFLLFLWAFVLLGYVQTTMFNLNMLYAHRTGKFVVEPTDLTPEKDTMQEFGEMVQQTGFSFESVRNDFCKVLP